MDNKFSFPTETVELPSKGLLYPKTSTLSKGVIEMKYMTAKEEDILTNTNFIRQGVAIEKVLKALIVSEVEYKDLLVGDRNAIMMAARILAYGSEYEVEYKGTTHKVDLSTFESKPLHPDFEKAKDNEFSFKLPFSGNQLTLKLLTGYDEEKIENEMKGLKKLSKDNVSSATVRLKHIITSVNGSYEEKDVREFVDNYLLSRDARALREYYTSITPDVDTRHTFTLESGEEEVADLPIGISFFYPELKL
jgi:hypothetical protein